MLLTPALYSEACYTQAVSKTTSSAHLWIGGFGDPMMQPPNTLFSAAGYRDECMPHLLFNVQVRSSSPGELSVSTLFPLFVDNRNF